jgi:hypothetical protein
LTVTSPLRPSDQDELQALIEEARRRARQRRCRNAGAFLFVALAVVVAYVLFAGDPGRVAAPPPAPRLAASPQIFQPGQFWYTRAISMVPDSEWAGGSVVRRDGYHSLGPRVEFDVRVVEESWVGVDGTMRHRVVATPQFASAADRAKWATYGRPVALITTGYDMDLISDRTGMFPTQLWYPWAWSETVGTPGDGPARVDVGDSLFSYRQLLSLPGRAVALRARLIRAERALAWRETHKGRDFLAGANPQADERAYTAESAAVYNTLDAIAGLLASPLPASLRLALVRTATTLTGASVNARARDSLDRPGVAVSAPEPGSENSQFTRRLVFDPTSGTLLEGGGLYEGPVLAQGVVDSVYALPRRVSPVRAVGALPAPQTLAISPATGNPTRVFKVTLFSSISSRRQRPPKLDWSVAGTPPLRCFTPGPLPPLRPSTTIRRAGRLGYVYRLGPPPAHGNAWCRGRYELQVAPTYSRRFQPPRSRWFYPLHNSIRYQRISPGIGSSIVFQVR